MAIKSTLSSLLSAQCLTVESLSNPHKAPEKWVPPSFHSSFTCGTANRWNQYRIPYETKGTALIPRASKGPHSGPFLRPLCLLRPCEGRIKSYKGGKERGMEVDFWHLDFLTKSYGEQPVQPFLGMILQCCDLLKETSFPEKRPPFPVLCPKTSFSVIFPSPFL